MKTQWGQTIKDFGYYPESHGELSEHLEQKSDLILFLATILWLLVVIRQKAKKQENHLGNYCGNLGKA